MSIFLLTFGSHPVATSYVPTSDELNGDSGAPEDDGFVRILESNFLTVFQRGPLYKINNRFT